MDIFKLRLVAALVLVVSLWALRMGLTHPQPRATWFWIVTAGFALQVIVTALYLAGSLWMRRTVERKPR